MHWNHIYMSFKCCGFWIFFEEKPASSTKSTKHLKLFDPLLSSAPAAKVRWFSPRSPHRQGGNDSSGVSGHGKSGGKFTSTFWDHYDVFVWCQVHWVLPPVGDWFDVNVLGTCAHVEWYATDGVRWGCSGWGGSQRSVNLHDMLNVLHNRWGWDGGQWGGKRKILMLTSLELVKQSYSQKRFRVCTVYRECIRGAEWAKKVKVNVCTKLAGTQVWMWLKRHVPTWLKNTSFNTINKRL